MGVALWWLMHASSRLWASPEAAATCASERGGGGGGIRLAADCQCLSRLPVPFSARLPGPASSALTWERTTGPSWRGSPHSTAPQLAGGAAMAAGGGASSASGMSASGSRACPASSMSTWVKVQGLLTNTPSPSSAAGKAGAQCQHSVRERVAPPGNTQCCIQAPKPRPAPGQGSALLPTATCSAAGRVLQPAAAHCTGLPAAPQVQTTTRRCQTPSGSWNMRLASSYWQKGSTSSFTCSSTAVQQYSSTAVQQYSTVQYSTVQYSTVQYISACLCI